MSGNSKAQLLPRGQEPGAVHDNKTGRAGSLPAKQAGQTQGWQLGSAKSPDHGDEAGLKSSWENKSTGQGPDQWTPWPGTGMAVTELETGTPATLLGQGTNCPGLRLKMYPCIQLSQSHHEENVRVIGNDRFICLKEISSVLVPSPVWGIKW